MHEFIEKQFGPSPSWTGAWGKMHVYRGSKTRNVRAHPTDFVLDDGQETRVGVTGRRTDEEIERRKARDSKAERRGSQVELEIN